MEEEDKKGRARLGDLEEAPKKEAKDLKKYG